MQHASTENGPSTSSEEVEALRQQLDELRVNSVSKAQYEELQTQFAELRKTTEQWQSKYQKLLTDLIDEVDEEKKIRLSTDVEIKRIKKLVQS